MELVERIYVKPTLYFRVNIRLTSVRAVLL